MNPLTLKREERERESTKERKSNEGKDNEHWKLGERVEMSKDSIT